MPAVSLRARRGGAADRGGVIVVVIPGRCETSNPEPRDSGFASSMRPGMTAEPYSTFAGASEPEFATLAAFAIPASAATFFC